MSCSNSKAFESTVAQASNEKALVAAAKAGDCAAFEELVNRTEKAIYRLGLSITGSREDAEEALQETFLKALEHLGDFREDSRFYTWLVRIALNVGLIKLRKRRSDKGVPIEDGLNGEGDRMPREFADWTPDPERILAQAELRIISERAMQTLPATRRAVFLLRDVEGFSTEETAELLNLAVGAVESNLHQARRQLREELSKVFQEVYNRAGENAPLVFGEA